MDPVDILIEARERTAQHGFNATTYGFHTNDSAACFIGWVSRVLKASKRTLTNTVEDEAARVALRYLDVAVQDHPAFALWAPPRPEVLRKLYAGGRYAGWTAEHFAMHLGMSTETACEMFDRAIEIAQLESAVSASTATEPAREPLVAA